MSVMNNNYFNPYAMGGQYTPNVNQSLNQLQNLLGQYQNMQQSNYRNQQVAMSNQGRWIYVNLPRYLSIILLQKII